MSNIDAAYCLCLDKRKDMSDRLSVEIESAFNIPMNRFWVGDGKLDVDYDRIDTAYNQYMLSEMHDSAEHSVKGHWNAFMSHKQMFANAVNNRWNKVLFLEDDAYVIPKRFDYIYNSRTVQDFINGDDWDGIYFGWQKKDFEEDTDDGIETERKWKESQIFSIEKPKRKDEGVYSTISGLHAALLHKRLFSILATTTSKGPIDAILNQNLNSYRMYYIAPKIMGSLASFSHTEGKWQNRTYLEN